MSNLARNEVEEMRTFFEGLVKNQGVRTTDIAKKLDYSHSMVSRFIKDGYCSAAFLQAAKSFKDNLENNSTEQQQEPEPEQQSQGHKFELKRDKYGEWEFIPTADALAVLGTADMVWKTHSISAVIGHPGTGKTRCIKEYCKRNSKAVYIRADVTMSAKELLVEIGEAIGENLSYGSLRFMTRRIINRLKSDPKILIIDEADLLLAGYTVKKAEVLRSIHDETSVFGCSLLLVGMPRLEALLKKGPSLKENLAQFDSRMEYVYRMNGLQRDELDQILNQLDITDEAKKQLINIAMRTSKGGVRQLTKILSRCLDLAQEGKITEHILREATHMLML